MMREQVIQFRRDLHQIPEIRLILPKTQAYIKQALQGLPCQLFEPIEYAVAAYFDNGKPNTIAFRSDMDALAVQECTGLAFASQHEGMMHACGHDGHMAMLLAFAHELSGYYQSLPHNVLLIFQPGEESPGGADPVCQSGILEKYHVNRIFGLHLWPDLEKHVIASKSGDMMARVSELHIDIYGKSAHAAKYQEGIDAIEAGVELVHALYGMEKQLPDEINRILRIGVFHGGSALNVVSDHAHLEGTIRAFDDEIFQYLCDEILEICEQLEIATDVTCQALISKGYPAVHNDDTLFQKISSIMKLTELKEPVMISEDFSYYQKRVPGVFMFLGTGSNVSLHNDHFSFDEEVLQTGVDAYIKLSHME